MASDKVWITVTTEARNALRSATRPGAHLSAEGSKQRQDGKWEILIDRETLARLEDFKFVGETMSDAVVRLVATRSRRLS
jgi:hypothetical protein